MRTSPLHAPFLALLAAACAMPSSALAQGAAVGQEEAAPAPPSEYVEKSRRAYAQGLVEAREMIVAKRYGDAIAKLDALLKERPREPQARFLRAVAMADSGKRDEAIAALRDLAADNPELPEVHNNLAVLYAAKGELAMARDELSLAIASRPDYAVARENLGDVYVRLAMGEYERAGKLDPASKTVPAKLKLAREIVPAPVPAPVPAAVPAAAGR